MFQLTAPLREPTTVDALDSGLTRFQLTAPLREPTIVLAIGRVVSVFQLTAPLREPTKIGDSVTSGCAVSTHGSLAGADRDTAAIP